MKVCIGNHDERVIRVAEANNIMKKYLRDFNEVWKTPGWSWEYEHKIDDVMYLPGPGFGGTYHAATLRDKMFMSVCAGHVHTAFMIHWAANVNRRIFGLNVGCGIDDKQMQFAYGKHMKQRSMLGCAVIIDGIPYLEPMPCGKGEKYHDSKFTKKRR